jgi:hypothetical protein
MINNFDLVWFLVVFAELYWNPSHILQAEDRAHVKTMAGSETTTCTHADLLFFLLIENRTNQHSLHQVPFGFGDNGYVAWLNTM